MAVGMAGLGSVSVSALREGESERGREDGAGLAGGLIVGLGRIGEEMVEGHSGIF